MKRDFRRILRRAPLAVLACLLAGAAPPDGKGTAATLTVEQAIALYESGKIAEAKQAFDTILVGDPNEPRSLYYSASINSTSGHPQIAIQQVLLLLKSHPDSLAALELEVQVYQALGVPGRRDAAIERLRIERDSMIHPNPRYAVAFTRDRFMVGGRTFITSERFDPGGETIVRYTFVEEATAAHPRHVIVLLSDPETNERWRDAANLTVDDVVYHLDTIAAATNGNEVHAIYNNYVGEPNYDTVRAAVTDILTGKAKPISGDADPYWVASGTQPAAH
jgi:tetratricopeptide (TPR) repeat protein